jgi:hypothetical protein
MQVQMSRTTFVQDRYQNGYFPQVGDMVVFRPQGGHRLTSWTTAVHFTKVGHIPR